MFPDYSTFKKYHHLFNCYATLGDTTKVYIEGICTSVCTLNGRIILTHNALHILALKDLLYSLHNHHQIPVFGVYSSYKDSSYLFFPDFIIHVEDSYDNIVGYQPLDTSHQGPIDYMEHKSTRSATMDTPSGRPSTITTAHTPQPSHNISSD